MYLLFDIGGTKTRLAYSLNGHSLDKMYLFDTQQSFQEEMRQLKYVLEQITPGQPVAKAVGGVAGVLSRQKDELLNSPNLLNWINQPLQQSLAQIISAPVRLENDASLGALGEAQFGSGQGYPIVGFLTIGTGVGGARVVDGQIDQNSLGFEPGHQTISTGGILCHHCHSPGHLESYISGIAIKQQYGVDAQDLTDTRAWDEISAFLAAGLNNLTVHWSPDVIILGGSVSQSLPLEKVEPYFKASCRIFPVLPPVRKAYLGEASGLYGALSLISPRQ